MAGGVSKGLAATISEINNSQKYMLGEHPLNYISVTMHGSSYAQNTKKLFNKFYRLLLEVPEVKSSGSEPATNSGNS